MKNSQDELKRRTKMTEDRINELEDRSIGEEIEENIF